MTGYNESVNINASLCNSLGEAIPLKNVSITGDLNGAMFEAQVRQTFQNSRKIPCEVIYSFPLPLNAVLLGVEAQLGEVTLSGSVIEASDATERYENTLAQGDAAIMLERGNDGHYVLNLGNLMPLEQCIITLRYGQLLPFEQGGLRLAIPTVIAPRYGDPLRDGKLAPHQVPDTHLLAEYNFNLSLTLHGELAQSRVASPSHPISVARNKADKQKTYNSLTVSLAKQSYLDRDFILILDQLAETSLVTLGPDYLDPQKFVATASFCPNIPEADMQKTAVKILVDCSGSMQGDSIMAARRALMSIIKQLNNGDKFSLSKFGSTVEHSARTLWPVTDRSRVSAESWITQLDANMGGTDIPDALESTLALVCKEACDILLITDGQTHQVQDSIVKAKASQHRIFTVGIGASPNASLLRDLAIETGGASDFVAAGEAVEPAIIRMFKRMRSPSISNIEVHWPKNYLPSRVNHIDTAIFDGDTLHVSAWFDNVPEGRVSLTGHLTGQTSPQELCSVQFKTIQSSPDSQPVRVSFALSRLAAAKSLVTEPSKSLATKIAVDYQLVTEHTNFLMLHERSAENKATQMPVLQKVPHMMPAGMGGTSAVSIDYCMRYVPSSKDLKAPNLLRNPRTSADSSDALESNSTHYEIPLFLRRGGMDLTPTFVSGQVLQLKAKLIWFKIDEQQDKILALLTDHLGNLPIRVWFTNPQHEIFDYLDFNDEEEAILALRLRGFSDYVKKRFSLFNRIRTRYTWKCEEHTRRYTHQVVSAIE